MSETVMLTTNPYDGERRPGTVGHPLPGVDLRLVSAETQAVIPLPSLGEASAIGGVEVRGPNVFRGYWNMPERTKEEFTADGWFKTGDVGRWDEHGYLALVGRSKDLIITGGYNVYPKEIEKLLDDWPGIEESAVFGVPHPDFGEAVTAVVVAKPGAQVETTALMASLKGVIANYKVPKQIHLLEALPRNVMGKVQKNLLRDQFSRA
jgi:malonyl-CoA/methylmalonyl-CoA synthetase